MELAQQLGGVALPFKGADIVSTIVAFAREYAITQIVLGRSRRPWYHRWLRSSILDGLLRALPTLDLIVVGEQ